MSDAEPHMQHNENVLQTLANICQTLVTTVVQALTNIVQTQRKHTSLLERLIRMSGTLSDQLTADFTAINTELGVVSTDLATVTSDVATLVSQLQPGTQVTQAQVDQAAAVLASLQTLDTGLQAVAASASAAITNAGNQPPAQPAPGVGPAMRNDPGPASGIR